MDLSGRPAARLALAADNGRYRLGRQAGAGAVPQGQAAAADDARWSTCAARRRSSDRQLDGELRLASPSLRAVGRGRDRLGGGGYRELRLGVDLLKPPALFRNMTGRNVRLVWTLDGPFGRADSPIG